MELGLVIYSPASLGWPRAPLPSRILMGESQGGDLVLHPQLLLLCPSLSQSRHLVGDPSARCQMISLVLGAL